MELKIDENGWLQIKRKNQWKDQSCPYNEEFRCGDWCPKFGEIRDCKIRNPDNFGEVGSIFTHGLNICDNEILYSENPIEDLRE